MIPEGNPKARLRVALTRHAICGPEGRRPRRGVVDAPGDPAPHAHPSSTSAPGPPVRRNARPGHPAGDMSAARLPVRREARDFSTDGRLATSQLTGGFPRPVFARDTLCVAPGDPAQPAAPGAASCAPQTKRKSPTRRSGRTPKGPPPALHPPTPFPPH